ncbi:MAG: endonuclease [Sphingomonadales bacterium]|nr:endonuclease [Sphingomonadales bacterium]
MNKPLKVVTYNIRKCVGTDRRRDPERILDVLREMDADIIALQEADRRFGQRETCLPFAKIDAETPWKPVPWGVRPNGIGWHGNAILVRDEMEIKTGRPLDLPTLEPRGAVWCEVETRQGPIRIIGVHLDLSGLWRRRQIRQILAALDNEPRHLPAVIMGDFNQWSRRGALSEFAFHHHRIIDTPKSFHATKPVARLDRIIVSHEITVLGNGVHESALSQKASDHLPIWAELALT